MDGATAPPLLVSLRLVPGSDPPAGEFELPGRRAQRFVGWLGLLAALQDLHDAGRASSPTGGAVPRQDGNPEGSGFPR